MVSAVKREENGLMKQAGKKTMNNPLPVTDLYVKMVCEISTKCVGEWPSVSLLSVLTMRLRTRTA